MLLSMLTATGILLALFCVIDQALWRREAEERPARRDPTPDRPLTVDGLFSV